MHQPIIGITLMLALALAVMLAPATAATLRQGFPIDLPLAGDTVDVSTLRSPGSTTRDRSRGQSPELPNKADLIDEEDPNDPSSHSETPTDHAEWRWLRAQ